MSNNIVGLTSYNGILRGGREIETWPPETISLCLCAPCYYILITVGLYSCTLVITQQLLTTRVIHFTNDFL